jgi:hypothetical protein
MVDGALVSLLIGMPLFLLDLLVASNSAIGTWAASSLFLPFLIYLGLACLLRAEGRPRMAWGMAIGGVVFSFLIVFLIFFLAFILSAFAESA